MTARDPWFIWTCTKLPCLVFVSRARQRNWQLLMLCLWLTCQFSLIVVVLPSTLKHTPLRMQRCFLSFCKRWHFFSWKHHRHVWGKENVNYCRSLRCADLWWASVSFCGLSVHKCSALPRFLCPISECSYWFLLSTDSRCTLPALEKNMQWHICALNERMFQLLHWCTMWGNVD